jgi:hypothetical protein
MSEEGLRINNILCDALQDGDNVAETLANVGFRVECFFDPSLYEDVFYEFQG